MAEEFPGAEIVGTDLSPIQPSYAPPNCRFFIDDVESEWAFETDGTAFDYIHGRTLGGAVSDWGRLLRRAYAHLRPGGWVEVQEFEVGLHSDDGSHLQAPLSAEWVVKLEETSARFGKQMNIARSLGGWIEEAGFVNVTDEVYKVRILGERLGWADC